MRDWGNGQKRGGKKPEGGGGVAGKTRWGGRSKTLLKTKTGGKGETLTKGGGCNEKPGGGWRSLTGFFAGEKKEEVRGGLKAKRQEKGIGGGGKTYTTGP